LTSREFLVFGFISALLYWLGVSWQALIV
jgi:hypothetical protein